MKMMISLMTLIGLFITQAQASSINLTVDSERSKVILSLDRENAFTQRLIDVIKQSPLVEEVNNDWIQPGTLFRGDGFNLDLAHFSGTRQAVLTIEINQNDLINATVSGQFLRVTSERGGFKHFHEALEQSKSPHALTQANPGRISPAHGTVAVLEGDFFLRSQHTLHCVRAFRNFKRSICSINL